MAIELKPKKVTVINPTDKTKSEVEYQRISVSGDDHGANFTELLQSVFNGDMKRVVTALVAGANKEAKANANPFRTAARDARKKITAARKMVTLMVETMGLASADAIAKVSALTGVDATSLQPKSE